VTRAGTGRRPGTRAPPGPHHGASLRPGQPPTRCSVIDSPTSTQWDSETQVTARRDWAAPSVDAPVQGRFGGPVRTSAPAVADAETVVPTSAQVAMARQDRPSRDAVDAGAGWVDHAAPPSSVVRITPCPLRVVTSVADVVPTAVQWTPGTPTGPGALVAVCPVPAGDWATPGAVVPGVVVPGVVEADVPGSPAGPAAPVVVDAPWE